MPSHVSFHWLQKVSAIFKVFLKKLIRMLRMKTLLKNRICKKYQDVTEKHFRNLELQQHCRGVFRTARHLRWSFLRKQRLKAVNQFCKRSPSQMLTEFCIRHCSVFVSFDYLSCVRSMIWHCQFNYSTYFLRELEKEKRKKRIFFKESICKSFVFLL